MKLFEAFSAAQGEFPTIPKNSEVTVKDRAGKFLYSYKYADLTEIISSTRPALAKHGISFTQDYKFVEGLGHGIVTTILYKSGESFDSGFVPCEVKGMNMKDVAGQFTYGKRISLTAALGISADEDVDAGSIEGSQGNESNRLDARPAAPPKNHVPPPPSKPKTVMQEILELVKHKGLQGDMPDIILKVTGGRCDNSRELTGDETKSLLNYLKMKS